jgi:hypothetical protein
MGWSLAGGLQLATDPDHLSAAADGDGFQQAVAILAITEEAARAVIDHPASTDRQHWRRTIGAKH